MIGALLIVNSRGELILSRAFRDHMNIRLLAESFRLELIATKRVERCPVVVIDKTCFASLRLDNLYFVVCSHENVDVNMCFQYLIRLIQILSSYCDDITENGIRDEFVTVQQLLDESIDYGYPQITEVDLLRGFIGDTGKAADAAKHKRASEAITIKATGKIPWRREGIVYRDNEVFIDVHEEVNLLMSQSGTVLQREVSGRVVMKTFLSGMPECRLVLNDRMLAQNAADRSRISAASSSSSSSSAAGSSSLDTTKVTLDDVNFHSCVKLSDFDVNRSICFVPPDGEFVLMRYRTSESVNPPFRIVGAVVEELAKTRVKISFTLRSDLNAMARECATDIVVKIPCPMNTASVKCLTTHGKAKYDAAEKAILWKLHKMVGAMELPFSGELTLISATLQSNEKVWTRPPVVLKFSVNAAVSGLKLESLKIVEPKLNYSAQPWVRYFAVAGQYEGRL